MNRRGWVGGALAGGTLFLGTPLASCSTFGEQQVEPADAGPEAASEDATLDVPAVEGTPFKCPWVIKNEGATIPIMAVAEDPPAPLGGAISPGTYTLTECIRYMGVGGSARTESENLRTTTLLLQSTLYALHEERSSLGSPTTDQRAGKFAVRGTTLEWTEVCSEVWGPETFGYTASANTIVLYRDNGPLGTPGLGGYRAAMVFTKR